MPTAPAGSLLHVLQQIPDPRGRQGRRHACSAMLAAIVCALLCGARSYSAMVQWIHAQPPELWHALGFTRKPPKLGAFRKLLMRLCPQTLEDALRPWVEQLLPKPVDEAELQAAALDGKSLCGTFAEFGRALHLLSLLDQATGYTLGQLEVDSMTNEHKTAVPLLKSLVLQGRVITGDAMFCQRELCQQIVDQGGHYFFEVKDNQPELKAAIEAEFHPAFSPLHGAAASGSAFDNGGLQQGAWPPRAAPSGGFHASGPASGLAGCGPSLPHRALAASQRPAGA